MARAPLFTWLKNKFYTKTEIDSKMNGKAPNTVVSSTSNGLMIATDKEKLDTVEVGANKTVVDGSMSATSSNPVQNKTVKAELDSLNSAKANISHTHNSLTPVSIPEGSDLNDYIEQGTYYCPSNSTVATLINSPTGYAFFLEVQSVGGAGVIQIVRAASTTQETYERRYIPYLSVKWYPWKQVQFIE